MIAYVDGGGAYEKRDAGVGVVLVDEDTGEVLWARGFNIGQKTNNEAEYSAVLLALYQAAEFDTQELRVYCDSKLIVNQINGEWKVHENHLKEYWEEVRAVSRETLKLFTIEWIPRAENKAADALARSAVKT